MKIPPLPPAFRPATARTRLILACLLVAIPGALTADDTPSPPPELRAPYCAGYLDAQEQTIGDTCKDAEAGWVNACSDVVRPRDRLLAQQRPGDPRNGVARRTGYEDYQQCHAELYSNAGVAQTQECQKRFTGSQLGLCISSGPATPACKRLLQCNE